MRNLSLGPFTRMRGNIVVEGREGSALWRVNVHVHGRGRPLVLLHSLLADRSSFDRVLEPLAAQFTVYAFDLPGFGSSDAVSGGLDAVADRVAAAMHALQLAQQSVVLGNGYGGFVALLMAIRHPTMVERLILADCGAAFSDAGRAAFRSMSSVAAQGGLAAVSDVAMRRLFSPEYQAQHPDLIADRRERFLMMAAGTFQAACNALGEIDLRPQLSAVSAPVLVLVGEVDEATPPAMSRELVSGLPSAQLVVLPGCAHVPQLQAPPLFLDVVTAFVSPALTE